MRSRPYDLVVTWQLLLAAQTEKDLPAGFGYLDHAFYGYIAALRAGFLPERRISCPMDGAYLPQHVRQARRDGRLLGQVRDLLVVRKPLQTGSKVPIRSFSCRTHPIVDQQEWKRNPNEKPIHLDDLQFLGTPQASS